MTFRELRLLADENISPKVVAFLRQQGLDVLDVKEQGWQGEDDETLLAKAHQDQRFVLTYDADFGRLAIHLDKPHYGIFYLRLRNLRPDYVNRILTKLLTMHYSISPGTLIVVEDTRLRIRNPLK